jgi:hypothetical protein
MARRSIVSHCALRLAEPWRAFARAKKQPLEIDAALATFMP